MNRVFGRIFFLTLLFSQPTQAALELITPDGERVLLNDDYTWEYVSSDRSQENIVAPQAILQVSHVDEVEGGACRLGVNLQNNLPYKIKNLTIRFSAYKSETIPYDSITRGFFEINSTDHQYRKIFFRGISCSEIHHIKMEDPGRCSMGELDRFSAQPGDCIGHIEIEPTELINIIK